MKKLWEIIVSFFRGMWFIIRTMGNWKGILSLVIVWLAISGSGLVIVGFIFNFRYLIWLGTTIYGLWLMPYVPLIPINIVIALLFQRYVFRDKNVGLSKIKDTLRQITKPTRPYTYKKIQKVISYRNSQNK